MWPDRPRGVRGQDVLDVTQDAVLTNHPRALVAWSSGKDSAWALQVLRQAGEVDVVGLLTTFNEAFDRVAMHAVRRKLVEAQARAAGLPLIDVPLRSEEHTSELQSPL